jgi:hypothetical protein
MTMFSIVRKLLSKPISGMFLTTKSLTVFTIANLPSQQDLNQ